MNKKLVALAVAGAFALPLTAEAQTANVTLYGRANLDMEVVSGKLADGSNPNVFRVATNSSRFGIRGVESLGGGVDAFFQVENSVNWDGNGGTIAGRDTWLGLRGSWGKAYAGRFLMPYDDLHAIFGNVPTFTTSILSTANLWANNGAIGGVCTGGGGADAIVAGAVGGCGFDNRYSNSIRWDSPTFAGFTAEFQYSTGETAYHSGAEGAGLLYNNGPLQAGMAYTRHTKTRSIATGPQLDNDNAFSITAAYKFGFIRPALVYEHLSYQVAQGTPVSINDLTRDFWAVSLTMDLGPGQLYLFYGDAQKTKGSAFCTSALPASCPRVGGMAAGPNSDAQAYSITYTYPFSKRTYAYTGYMKINNSDNASYTFNINNYATAVGGKPGGFVLGMVHSF